MKAKLRSRLFDTPQLAMQFMEETLLPLSLSHSSLSHGERVAVFWAEIDGVELIGDLHQEFSERVVHGDVLFDHNDEEQQVIKHERACETIHKVGALLSSMAVQVPNHIHDATLFVVRWTIDVHAETDEDAARLVQDKYFKPGHEGMAFDVKLYGSTGAFRCIDLLESDYQVL